MNQIELAPAVFAVKEDYHIMLYPSRPCLMWVKVGNKIYYDESNGILRSCTDVHRVIIPMQELDEAKKYAVCLRYIIDRKPYFPEMEPIQEQEYHFRPVSDTGCVRAYHIADAHNWAEGPIAAAKTFGKIDFLILNGDIPEHNGSVEKCRTIYELVSEIAKGEIPTVFARGNHDLRGLFAERFWECTPTDNGKTYYTFRLGSIWGMLLDCGEDKLDDHEEYGGTICCHDFRVKETDYIKDIISHADTEYMAEGVLHRMVICHCPFTYRMKRPFDIEEEIYTEWTKLLREHVHPDIIVNGHLHSLEMIYPGDERDHRNQPCLVVVGAEKKEREYYAGTGFEFNQDGIQVYFTDNHGDGGKLGGTFIE